MDVSSNSQGTLLSSGEDSSKSTSSKQSSTKSQEGKERDLEKDNAASPIDLECHIQEERITKILDEMIYKTKLTICLPIMIQNYNFLESKLSSQHLQDLIFIFEQYDNPLFSASLLNMAALEDIKAGDISLKNRLNPELGHLLYILNSYPSLADHVNQMSEKMKANYLSSNMESQESGLQPALQYLVAIERFRELTVAQMQTTAAEELSYKLHTKKLEISNAKLIAQIKDMTDTMNVELSDFESRMKIKNEIIANLEKELNVLNKAAESKLKKKVLDADRQMVLKSRAHKVRHEMIKEEEVDTREGYHSMLRQHMIDEKAQRARRFKVQTQLLSWLQKYDNEMSDKQHDHDELERKYNEESAKVEELEKKIEEQEIEYLQLMKERDDEYHEEMTRKMKEHQLEHSARVIQNAWRQVLLNRQEKRKLKILLRKVKAERERQQKLADLRELKARKEEAKQAKLAKQAAKDALAARTVKE